MSFSKSLFFSIFELLVVKEIFQNKDEAINPGICYTTLELSYIIHTFPATTPGGRRFYNNAVWISQSYL
jgi:hypothetical protein